MYVVFRGKKTHLDREKRTDIAVIPCVTLTRLRYVWFRKCKEYRIVLTWFSQTLFVEPSMLIITFYDRSARVTVV